MAKRRIMRQYTQEEKDALIEKFNKLQMTTKQFADLHGLPSSTVYTWVQQAEAKKKYLKTADNKIIQSKPLPKPKVEEHSNEELTILNDTLEETCESLRNENKELKKALHDSGVELGKLQSKIRELESELNSKQVVVYEDTKRLKEDLEMYRKLLKLTTKDLDL